MSFIDKTFLGTRKKKVKYAKAKEGYVLVKDTVFDDFKVTSNRNKLNDTKELDTEQIPNGSDLIVKSDPDSITILENPTCAGLHVTGTLHATPTTTIHQEQLQGGTGTTVLTQDIIDYLLKAKSDEKNKKEDDILQSIASFVSESAEDTTNLEDTSRLLSTSADQPQPINTVYTGNIGIPCYLNSQTGVIIFQNDQKNQINDMANIKHDNVTSLDHHVKRDISVEDIIGVLKQPLNRQNINIEFNEIKPETQEEFSLEVGIKAYEEQIKKEILEIKDDIIDEE